MDLPLFALHTVVFPGQRIELRVFEERYLRMMEDLLPEGRFAVVAIRRGQEVGGEYDPYRVGVAVRVEDYDVVDDDPSVTYHLRLAATERLALIAPLTALPYPRWDVEPFPDEGGAGPQDVARAKAELLRYLAATGETESPALPADPGRASYAIAVAAPGPLPIRQGLLEIPGVRDRLTAVGEVLRRESALVRVLGAADAHLGSGLNPN
jgi:uncharacterized protein